MKFHEALQFLLAGQCEQIARRRWKGSGGCVAFTKKRFSTVTAPGQIGSRDGGLILMKAGELFEYSPTGEDLITNDWTVKSCCNFVAYKSMPFYAALSLLVVDPSKAICLTGGLSKHDIFVICKNGTFYAVDSDGNFTDFEYAYSLKQLGAMCEVCEKTIKEGVDSDDLSKGVRGASFW